MVSQIKYPHDVIDAAGRPVFLCRLIRGRGLIQITGRSNYHQCSLGLFGDERLLELPELLEQAQWAAESAAWFWERGGLNALADRDEFNSITRRINGGLNGLQDRLQLWARARAVLCSPVV